MENRITAKDVFQPRKGLTAIYHQSLGSAFLFGGIGHAANGTMENFSEDTLQFSKLVEGKLGPANSHKQGEHVT